MFRIDKRVFEKFPELIVGVLVCKNLDNSSSSEDVIKEIKKQEDRIRKEYDSQTLSQEQKIDVWRRAYSFFGAKPKDNRSSVENIYKLVLQGSSIRHINKLVDAYNLISLKYMLPVGGEDLNKIKGDIFLTISEANEAPVLLLGDKEPRPPHEGEVIYKDDVSAICRRFNWREAERTKLTEETKNCILVIEGMPPATKQEVTKAVNELKDLLQKICRGEYYYKILDAKEAEIHF
ncbi:MAG: hypothetical protein JW791_01360 [Nanoarchaeota archaeon]|nr:hypothetical protein [Nanoarchaeota archaeon]